jgi:ATP-dependent Zn protease
MLRPNRYAEALDLELPVAAMISRKGTQPHRRGRAYLSGPQLGQGRPYADATQQLIHQEVSRLLAEAGHRARELLTEHRAALDAGTGALLERETISGRKCVRS